MQLCQIKAWAYSIKKLAKPRAFEGASLIKKSGQILCPSAVYSLGIVWLFSKLGLKNCMYLMLARNQSLELTQFKYGKSISVI